jgi:hypothetical protein
LLTTLVCVVLVYSDIINGTWNTVYGLLIVALGIPVYYLVKPRKHA